MTIRGVSSRRHWQATPLSWPRNRKPLGTGSAPRQRAQAVRRVVVALAAAVVLAAAGDVETLAASRQPSTASRDQLRDRVEARFEVVPLSHSLVLRPKTRAHGVRLIELTDDNIEIDGEAVTGRELRERLEDDADIVLQLSYLSAAERREMFAGREGAGKTEGVQPEKPRTESSTPERPAIERRRTGERVRVFGSVVVDRDESVDGQVVAVLGSARIDGEVREQVVAVLGSVILGPDADVHGDVVAVGGRVERDPSARIGGSINEVSLMGGDVYVRGDGRRIPWHGPSFMFDPFAGVARLMMTLFRLFLLALIGSLLVLIARETVDHLGERVRFEPLRAAAVGVLAELLFFPALILAIIVLSISIIGIPLLLLIPFAIVAALVVLLVGFIGAADAAGGWAGARLGWSGTTLGRVWLGLATILAPLILARLIALGGPVTWPFALALAAVAFLIEYVAWAMGFGAALIGVFERWRARRSASRLVAPAPPPAP